MVAETRALDQSLRWFDYWFSLRACCTRRPCLCLLLVERIAIIRQARQLDANQRPRVDKIDENTSQRRLNTVFPLGFIAIFFLHMITILLMFGLLPLWLILGTIKNERLDQTMRIVWVVLACTAGLFSNPVYWYLYVWRSQSSPPAPQVT